MAAPSRTDPTRRRLRRYLTAVVLFTCALWFTLFDSHSLYKRIRWHREYVQLTRENMALQEQIDVLEARLDEPVSDEVVEQIAREQYGMRRPGETVYRTEELP